MKVRKIAGTKYARMNMNFKKWGELLVAIGLEHAPALEQRLTLVQDPLRLLGTMKPPPRHSAWVKLLLQWGNVDSLTKNSNMHISMDMHILCHVLQIYFMTHSSIDITSLIH